MRRLEAQFITARTRAPAPLRGWHSREPALHAVARAITVEMDSDARRHGEPHYHNRHHIAEAVVAMDLLCREALAAAQILPRQAELGVLAMLGHDLGHDGSLAPDGVLEAKAADRVASLAQGLDADDIALLRRVILGTAPALVPANLAHATAEKADPHDLLTALANEADVLASLMPLLGCTLSEHLAAEWRTNYPARAEQMLRWSSRRCFLQLYAAPTLAARRLGVDGCIAWQLDRITPDWDDLPRAEAVARLTQAVNSVPPVGWSTDRSSAASG